MQKSYSTHVPVVDGVHTQAHGLHQTEQFSQHSVQYGQQGLAQQGLVQHGTMTQAGDVQRGIIQGSVQDGMVQQGVAQQGAVHHSLMQQGAVQHGMASQVVGQQGVTQQAAVQHGMTQQAAVQHDMTQQTAVQHGMTQQAAVQHGMTTSPQPQMRGSCNDNYSSLVSSHAKFDIIVHPCPRTLLKSEITDLVLLSGTQQENGCDIEVIEFACSHKVGHKSQTVISNIVYFHG